MLYLDSGISMDEGIVLGDMIWSYNKSRTLRKIISFCVFILTAHSTALSTNVIPRSSFTREALHLYTVSDSSIT